MLTRFDFGELGSRQFSVISAEEEAMIGAIYDPVNDNNIVRVIKMTPIPQLNSLGGLYEPVMKTLTM